MEKRAADSASLWDARKNVVVERIRDLSTSYTLRHVASILGMTQPYLSGLAERHGIKFVDTKISRSKRLHSSVVARERQHAQALVHRSLRPLQGSLIDSDKISPQLRDKARREELRRENTFIEHLRELGKTHTRAQACRATGLSPGKLRLLCYDHDLAFVDAPILSEAEAQHGNLESLRSSLFKITRSTPKSLVSQLSQYLISDEDDQL